MLGKIKWSGVIVMGVGIALLAGCNQNKAKFPKGSTLTIKCLKEVVAYEEPIEEIVKEFEQTYPNVKINLVLQEATTDNVKGVNEALKRGEGEDIIIGNALPFQTYAEKGYLLDITDSVESAEKEMKVKLFDQMKKSFSINGKIYAVPCGFKLYAVQGSKAVIDASKSTQEFAEQISNEYLQHPQMKVRQGETDFADLVYPIEIAACWNTLYEVSAEKIYDDGDQVSVKEMGELLRSIKKIKETTYKEKYTDISGGAAGEIKNQIDDLNARYYPTALDQVRQRNDLFAMQGYRNWKGKEFILLGNGEESPYYSACFVMGISSNNTNKELAEEFLKYMMTYQENVEYLPIARTYMEENLQGKYKMNDVKEYHSKENEGYIITPEATISKKNQERLLEQMDAAVLIKNDDGAIKGIVTKYAQEYINNRIGLQEAINVIQEEIDNYMNSL